MKWGNKDENGTFNGVIGRVTVYLYKKIEKLFISAKIACHSTKNNYVKVASNSSGWIRRGRWYSQRGPNTKR